MQLQFRASIIPAGFALAVLAGSGYYAFAGGDPIPGTEPITVGTPKKEGPAAYVGGSPVLTAGFKDWESCELGGRVETQPGIFFVPKWGPAVVTGVSGGCGPCGGGGSFGGSPETAAMGLRQAAISGQTARDYTYDAFGRRVKTVVGSQTNRCLYHGWHMIGEYDSTASHWLWRERSWNEGERMLEHIARDPNSLDSDTNVTEYWQYAVHEDLDTLSRALGVTAATLSAWPTLEDVD